MTKFFGWRKATWALLLWTVAMAIWLLVGNIGLILLVALWIGGMLALTSVWTMSRPISQTGRGIGDGFFVRPGRGNWRLLNLHDRDR